jgi:hypothetical protein
MSEVKVNKISPRSGTTVTLGDSGDTITLASGVSLTGVNATFSGDLTVDTNTLFVDSSTNRVGIGTSSPSKRLHSVVSSSGSLETALALQNSNAVDGTETALDFSSNTSFVATARISSARDGAGLHSLRFSTYNLGLSEAMRIDSSGNVGIGTTTTSSAKLNIQPNSAYLRIKEGRVDATNNIRLEAAGTVNTYLEYRGYLGHIWDVDTTEAMRINSSGSLFVGLSSSAITSRFHSRGAGLGSGTWTINAENSNGNQTFGIRDDGYMINPQTYNATTASAENVHVSSAGYFFRSTSSRRYKNTINDATKGLDYLCNLRPVTFKGNDTGDKLFYGLIAEEVDEVGLSEFVDYNEDNQPDAVQYSRMVSLCIKAIQELKADNDALRTRIETIENA